MPSWREILENPNCLESFEVTEENLDKFKSYLNGFDNYSLRNYYEGQKLHESQYLAIPEKWRKYINSYNVGVECFDGPWLLKYDAQNPEFVRKMINTFGVKLENFYRKILQILLKWQNWFYTTIIKFGFWNI